MFPSSFPSIFQITFTFANTCTHFISVSSINKVRIYIYEILVCTMYQLVMLFFFVFFLRFYIFDSMPQCFLLLLVNTDVTFSLGKGQKLDYGNRNLNSVFYYVSVI